MDINILLKLDDVSSTRGAPMGRRNRHPVEPVKLYLQRVEFVDGCYDKGGAYWGGGTPLYCAFTEDQEVRVFLRAENRDEAKRILTEEYADLSFWR